MKTSSFAALFFAIVTSACGVGETVPPHVDAGMPSPDANEPCDGVCLQNTPTVWSRPELVWMGDDEAAAPACPPQAPIEDFTGHGYLEGPIACQACKCGPTDGWCDQPAKVTAAAASCKNDGPSVTHTSFDPSDSWTGTCTSANAIPAGQLCGGVPCVQSVTIVPAMTQQFGCLPGPSNIESPPPWNRFMRACFRTPKFGCGGIYVCAPASPGPEFKECVFLRGNPNDWDCPAPYLNKSTFYTPPDAKCAPCSCDTPSGAACAATMDLYQDGSCGMPLGSTIAINAKDSVCIDVPPGSALGSKKASTPFYQPGTCKPSGGAPEGTVFCCMP